MASDVAGYEIVAEMGPCPGGTLYRSLCSKTRTPAVIRRIRADWLAPDDSISAFIQRAKAANQIKHKHLINFIDVGTWDDDIYVILEPFEGGDLQMLVEDIGPMTVNLATKYILKVATALNEAHQVGISHGALRPDNLRIGPLTPMSKPRADGKPRFRPGANSRFKVAEFGLIPRRPALNDWPADDTNSQAWMAYLPPERLTDSAPTSAGDVYSLGATFYYMLTGRPLYQGKNAPELRSAIEAGLFPRLEQLRPDLTTDLVALIYTLLSTGPNSRPSMSDILNTLHLAPTPSGHYQAVSSNSSSSSLDSPLAQLVEEALKSDSPLVPDPIDVSPSSEMIGSSSSEMLSIDNSDIRKLRPIEALLKEAKLTQQLPDRPDDQGRFVNTKPVNQGQLAEATAQDFDEWHESSPLHATGFEADGSERPDSDVEVLEVDVEDAENDNEPEPRKRSTKRGRLWTWVLIGVGLQLAAIALWVFYFLRPF